VTDDTTSTAPPSERGRAEVDQALAAALAGAGLIHVAMAPSHLGDDAVLGAGFLTFGVLQLALAIVVVVRPGRLAWAAAAGVSAVAIAAWGVSRTVGLPFGAHEGVAEPIAFVDGVAAALGVAALAMAVARIVSPAPRAEARALPAFARAATVVALVATLSAVASPSAREHGGGGDGHGAADGEVAGGHGHEPADDLGYSALANGEMASHGHGAEGEPAAEATLSPEERGALATQLAATAPLVAAYPTIADAKAAGYTQAGPFSPGLGIHYSPPGTAFNADGDMDAEDLAGGMLIYDGIEDDAPLAGFMYMAYQEEPPEGFVGDLDMWHSHSAVCIVSTPDGIETPFGADLEGITQEMCEAEGGSLIDFTGYMVHVWTVPGYESPEGVFSDLNPTLTCPDGTYYKIETRDIGSADTTCRV
jgi:hypothetical protein